MDIHGSFFWLDVHPPLGAVFGVVDPSKRKHVSKCRKKNPPTTIKIQEKNDWIYFGYVQQFRKWLFIEDFPIQNGDFPEISYVKLPEGTHFENRNSIHHSTTIKNRRNHRGTDRWNGSPLDDFTASQLEVPSRALGISSPPWHRPGTAVLSKDEGEEHGHFVYNICM